MFYFKLYNNDKLSALNHDEKIKIVNSAAKRYRKEKPHRIFRRLSSLSIWSGIPSLVLFLIVSLELAVGWFAMSSLLLNIKLANDECAEIEPYLKLILENKECKLNKFAE